MAHEIDFWNVSTSGKSADAISMRFTNPDTGQYAVVIIDGGYAEFGDGFADKIRTYYETNRVDLVISTHPDADHINGLTAVLDDLQVTELMIHQPRTRGYTSDDVACDTVDALLRTAHLNGTVVSEPRQGAQRFGEALTILGPDEDYYAELLAAQMGIVEKSYLGSAMKSASRRFSEVIDWVRDKLYSDPGETLTDDDGGTSARNNTSVVTLLSLDGHGHLFTGDAGVPAITRALDFREAWGLTANPLNFVQVPHHGSRHNVDRDLLNRLLGLPGTQVAESIAAFVSASEQDPHHPHAKVLNAFKRRGCFMVPTEGSDKWHNYLMPDRANYTAVSQLPWYDES